MTREANLRSAAAYYAANKDKVLARLRERYAANPDLFKARRKARYLKHKNKELATNAAYRASHQAEVLAGKIAYYTDNKEKVLANCAAYKKSHPWVPNASKAKRRAAQLLATPAWADLNAIKDVYLEAAYMQMHVDHIVPLQGKSVCGLHVWDNLQLLTASENSSKHNKFTHI